MATVPDQTADRELKERHRKMWGLGDYPAMARDFLLPLGERLAEAAGAGPGVRVLDVASGTGNAAIAAARRGADVVASDLTPELFDDGRALAREAGVELEWVQADAEALPFGDAEFDVVMSSIGVMFAPHHEAAAAELLRVCRPGGTIALINWTPEGISGDVFRTMGPYMPAPPPGATPPPRWGSEEHVRELLGAGVSELRMERDVLMNGLHDDPSEFREYFKERYGPTIVAYRTIGDDAERARELDDKLGRAAEAYFTPGEGLTMEYLLVVARRA